MRDRFAEKGARYMIVAEQFLPLLHKYDPSALVSQSDTVYGLWPDATIAFLNQGWFHFAKDNNAIDIDRWALGASVLTAIPDSLRSFYQTHFDEVLRNDCVWEHVYECSSPEAFRLFHMLTYPLAGEGLLVVNSLRNERPHDRLESPLPLSKYEDSFGIIHQCSHCRRVRRVSAEETWDWVPQLVSSPSGEISHGLCFPCFTFYYQSDRDLFPAVLSTINVTRSPEETSEDQ
jgi:hypothetical protein